MATPRPRADRRHRIVAGLLLLGILAAAGYTWTQQHVYRVTLRPGESTAVDVRVPMRRRGDPMALAGRGEHTVTCRLLGETAPGVHVFVTEPRHTAHWLHARVVVEAGRRAGPGRSRRTVEFTFNGEGGWPTADVVVRVKGPKGRP